SREPERYDVVQAWWAWSGMLIDEDTTTGPTSMTSRPRSRSNGISERRRRVRVVARVIDGGKAAGMGEAPFGTDARHRGRVGGGVEELVVCALEAGVLDELVRRGAERSLE